MDILQLFVIVEEKFQILVGDVAVGAAAKFTVLFFGGLAAGKGEFVDLLFDLVGGVCEGDVAVGVGAGHFASGALEGGEENGVWKTGFEKKIKKITWIFFVFFF